MGLWTEEIAAVGPIDLRFYDAHPDPVGAALKAESDRADVLFGPYGRGPALAVARASCGVVWNGGGATDRLVAPQFPRVVNIPAPAVTYLKGGLEAIHSADPRFGTLVILHTARGFSEEVARGAMAAASELGFSVTEVVFQPGRVVELLLRSPKADVLAVVGSFRDEVEAIGAVNRGRWRAILSVAAGVDEVLETLGA